MNDKFECILILIMQLCIEKLQNKEDFIQLFLNINEKYEKQYAKHLIIKNLKEYTDKNFPFFQEKIEKQLETCKNNELLPNLNKLTAKQLSFIILECIKFNR